MESGKYFEEWAPSHTLRLLCLHSQINNKSNLLSTIFHHYSHWLPFGHLSCKIILFRLYGRVLILWALPPNMFPCNGFAISLTLWRLWSQYLQCMQTGKQSIFLSKTDGVWFHGIHGVGMMLIPWSTVGWNRFNVCWKPVTSLMAWSASVKE